MAKSAAPLIADPQDTKSFSAFLADLEDGQLDRDLSAELRAMIARMKHSHTVSGGKPNGKIVLTIELMMVDGMIHTGKSFRVEPQSVRPVEVFYPTQKGQLTRNSPYIQEPLLQTMPSKGSR